MGWITIASGSAGETEDLECSFYNYHYTKPTIFSSNFESLFAAIFNPMYSIAFHR